MERLRMTAAEFFDLPETHQPTELIDGEITVSPAPALKHQSLIVALIMLLGRIAPHGRTFVAPTDVYLDEENVVQPDVLWLSPESACVPVQNKYLRGAPDLVIEVFSASTGRRDRREKFVLYEKHGVREYWIVDPDARFVEVWRREEAVFVHQGVYGPEDAFDSVTLGQAVELKPLFD